MKNTQTRASRALALGLGLAMIGGFTLAAAAPATAAPAAADPTYSITGTVNVDNGDPAEGATVLDTNNDANYTSTDADGHFTLAGLPNGDYTIEISKAGYGTVTTGGTIVDADGTLPGGTVTLNANPVADPEPATYSISGVVTAKDANPDFAPSVLLSGVEGSSPEYTEVDSNGNFTIDRLDPSADLSLTISAEGYGTVVKDVPITDANVTVQIELLPNLTAGTATITGTPAIGSTLTAKSTGWPAGTTLSYEWFYSCGQCGGAIDGATDSTYTLTNAEAGYYIGVNITGSKDGFSPTVAQSDVTAMVPAPKKAAAAAPVANSDALSAYLTANGAAPQAQTSAGLPAGDLNPSKSYTANVTWSAPDSFVDVYLYSSPMLVGTFPIVNGVAQITLSADALSQLAAGSHTLVIVGQSSGAVQSVALSVAPALAETGFNAIAPAGAALLLLLLGGVLLVVRRRRVHA